MKSILKVALSVGLFISLTSTTWANTNTVLNAPGGEVVTSSQVQQNAIQPVNSPSFGMCGSLINIFNNNISANKPTGKGLQFKNAVLTPGFTYTRTDDDAPGGFGSNEYGADLALDADVYNGLIVGAIYQHVHRSGESALAVSERLDSDGFSIYAAKRIWKNVNVGLAYNYGNTEHRLTRALNVNLDRESHGVTALIGLSDRKVFWSSNNKWNWNLTTALSHVSDLYDTQKDLDTDRFTLSSGLGYDITKKLTFGAAFSYHNFIAQDTFGGPTRDDDYWTIGPRLTYYATDRITVNMEFDDQEGFTDVGAFTGRVAVNIAF